MSIDITQIAVALIGLATTAVTVIFVPKAKAYIENRLGERQIGIIIALAEQAVKFAEESLWQSSGRDKRRAAAEFLTGELGKYGIAIDADAANKYLDSAVLSFIRAAKQQ
jgi:hypothetical protein